MSDDDSNVVAFKRRPDLSEDFRRSSNIDRKGKCPHDGHKIVDEKHRTVECEKCGALLDPVTCILEIVDEWRTYHGPRLKAIREYMTAKKQAGEGFAEWWQRVGRGRSYATKKRAAEEAWIMRAMPDLKLCTELVAKEDEGVESRA